VRLVFDPAKEAANLAKHGLSLARAVEFDLGHAVIRPDERHEYGEPRWRAYGMMNDRVHMMGFTLRDGDLRVISLRRANVREKRRYG